MLWHGTRQTDPRTIVKTEHGLDMRFSAAGAYGNGIYFADNSAYSHNYAHPVPGMEKTYQMLFCFVLVGESFASPPNNQLKMPPMKPDSDQRYDSITNPNNDHYIVYDNNK